MGSDMTINAVIAFLRTKIPDAVVGKTAQKKHKNYQRATDVDFVRCRCADADPEWEYPEFIGKTKRGSYIYVGCDSRTKTISCGPKGYHSSQYRDNDPCV